MARSGRWRAPSLAVFLAACGLAAALTVAICLATPSRYEVAGVSMAPGLMPGDVVTTGPFPTADAIRAPRRFERWVLAAPDGTSAVKRVVGLPGETVSIAGGDLAIDDRVAPPPPAVLAERATPIAGAARAPTHGALERTFPAVTAVDDADFAPRERRVLLPVRDVGLSAVVRITRPAMRVDVRIRVDGLAVRWRIAAAGRHAFVAGRLDGHLVGVSWPLGDTGTVAPVASGQAAPGALPPWAPATWDVVRVMPSATATPAADTVATLLALAIEGASADGSVAIEHAGAWRDLLYRPAADGRAEWTLGADEFLLLGDFPSGSRDSRHWGPLARSSLRHRVAALAARRRPLTPNVIDRRPRRPWVWAAGR